MGKGDKKSRRGKIIIGSYGVSRPRNKKKTVVPAVKPKEEKLKAKAEEEVKIAVVETAVEEKKVAKKAAPKKAAETSEVTEAKPKAAKTRKKAEPKEGEAAAEAPKE